MIDDLSGIAADLEEAQQEAVQLRREIMRWKMLARQHEARIREMEASASWRITAVLRLLPGIRRRWKVLLLLGVLALLSMPLWPLFVAMALFARGRALLWSVVWKIRPLHDVLSYLKQRLLSRKGQARGTTTAVVPLRYRRPSAVEHAAVADDPRRARWQLTQQLSPQLRVRLERYRLSRDALLNELELPELQSLSSAETGMLRMLVSQYATGAEQGTTR